MFDFVWLYWTVSIWKLLNFLHIKQNTYSPCTALTKHNPPALKGHLVALWYTVFPLLLPLPGRFRSVSLPLRLLAVSLTKLHTFPRWLALPLPCSVPLTFFLPPLRSSLQWAEKHTCQIQVAHHTVSHPHQLLSTRCFDPHKFFSCSSGLILRRWMQQLFTVSVTDPLRCLGPLQGFLAEGE